MRFAAFFRRSSSSPPPGWTPSSVKGIRPERGENAWDSDDGKFTVTVIAGSSTSVHSLADRYTVFWGGRGSSRREQKSFDSQSRAWGFAIKKMEEYNRSVSH
jgi:hypothetical protein